MCLFKWSSVNLTQEISFTSSTVRYSVNVVPCSMLNSLLIHIFSTNFGTIKNTSCHFENLFYVTGPLLGTMHAGLHRDSPSFGGAGGGGAVRNDSGMERPCRQPHCSSRPGAVSELLPSRVYCLTMGYSSHQYWFITEVYYFFFVASVKSRDTENYISCSRLFDEVRALRRALGKSVFSHCPFREQLTNAGVGLGSPVTETALNATSKEPELLKEEVSYVQADGTAVNYRSCWDLCIYRTLPGKDLNWLFHFVRQKETLR